MKKITFAVAVAAVIWMVGAGAVRAETLVLPADDVVFARPLPLRPGLSLAPSKRDRRVEPASGTTRSLEAVLKSGSGASASQRRDSEKAYNPIVIPLW